MALNKMSKFYYGHNVTSSNSKIDFNEGASDLVATLNVGDYSLTEYVAEIQRALNDSGALTYTASVDRDTRYITIAATGTFSLKAATGANISNAIWTLAGFASTDVSGAATYTGTSGSGSEFKPQFFLQKYISFDDQESASYSSVNKSAGGKVEVVSFGTEYFCNLEISYQSDIIQAAGSIIENDASGVSNLRTFMQYITKKRKIEFMPDRDTEATFHKCLLEATPSSGDGTGFVLNEYLGTLPGYFSTGVLRFRKVI
tara:strand:+ start:5498 stop:6271 length:774 start_codon:yes stop_codon:yes gene_type:complete